MTSVGLATPLAAREVARVRGVIDKNTTWSGRVLLTDDVAIQGAAVSVEPGTIVEFAGEVRGRGPILSVADAQGLHGRPSNRRGRDHRG
jgi:hypothetical protein